MAGINCELEEKCQVTGCSLAAHALLAVGSVGCDIFELQEQSGRLQKASRADTLCRTAFSNTDALKNHTTTELT